MKILALTALILAADASNDDAGWKEATKTDGITVQTRQREGTSVHEVKASGIIDAPPMAAWKVIRDYAHYDQNMPYTEESQVLSNEGDGKLIRFYSVVNAPIVSRRDYVVEIRDVSEWKDGAGFLKVVWKAVPDAKNSRSGIVRVRINDGYWILEPREGGKKTFATYYLYTDPAGSLPKFLVNKANTSAVPDVFRAVRKGAAKNQ
jgi:hypothetical protein